MKFPSVVFFGCILVLTLVSGLAQTSRADNNPQASFARLDENQASLSHSRHPLPAGPQRDNPGDVIRQFQLPYVNNGGLAWDGEYIWGTTRNGAGVRRLFALNPENANVERNFVIDQSDAIGLMYEPVENVLWVNEYVAHPQPSIAHVYNRNGEQVRTVRLPRGGHWDYCTDGTFVYGNNEWQVDPPRIYKLTREGQVVNEGPNIQALINHGRCVSIEYVPAHPDGQIWAMSVGYITQLNIDWENNRAAVIREFRGNNPNYPHQGITHDGFNMWAGGSWAGQVGYVYDDGYEEVYGVFDADRDRIEFGPVPSGQDGNFTLRIFNLVEEEGEQNVLRYTITDLGDDPDWLTIEPAEGEVNPREFVDVAFTAATEGLELGEYDREVSIQTNDPDHRDVRLPVHIFVVEGFGQLFGRVTNAGNNTPIEGTTVTVDYFGFEAVTDADGRYVFEDIPSWTYDLVVTKPDFLPLWRREVVVGPGEEVAQDFALLHSVCSPSIRRIDQALPPGDSQDLAFTITNSGNGPLSWSLERVFPEVANIEPLTHRWRLPVAQVVNNDRIGAVEFVNDSFYVAGGVSGGDNLVYVLNRDGELVRQFTQFAESNYGFRGLAWDGELLWGYDANVWWGFNTNGVLQRQFASPFGAARAACWDTDNNQFWMCNITTNLYAVSAEGQVIRQIARPNGLRIYGLAWFPADIDGYKLWMFCGDGDNRRQIWKVDVINNRCLFVFEPEIDGTAGSLSVSGLWDPWCWVLISSTNSNPDAIEIWQLGSRTDWLAVEPTEGELPAGEAINITVTLDATGLPADEDFTADLVFTHDGVGGQTVIPVVLSIRLGEVRAQRTLELPRGWSMVSVNLQPEPADDIRALMRPLVDDNNLLLMKDGAGHFYNPEFDFSNIPGWNVAEGYLIKTDHDGSLTLEGMTVLPDAPIALIDGWQMIAYYPRVAVDAIVAFSGIVDQLILAKDGAGHFYNPEWGFSNMGSLVEGQGYQVKMDGAAELVYRLRAERAANYELRIKNYELRGRLPEHVNTGENMSLLVLAVGWDGAEVGVYAGEALVGSGVVVEGRCGIAVWGDDPTTPEIDGAVGGAALCVKLVGMDGMDCMDVMDVLQGEMVYKTDGFTAVKLDAAAAPLEFGLMGAYPNPFNGAVRLTYQLPEAGFVSLRIYDLSGRLTVTLTESAQTAGTHTSFWDASTIPSGLYIARLDNGAQSAMMKLTLIK